ncbi:methionine--tRNA ligase [bacterium]|nr:methionine--tRNA ligase [bacterium]
MHKRFYITTAIDYVNALPHLGTAYEKIGADVLARFKRMAGYDVFFCMGVDEHSLKVAKQAQVKRMNTKSYCDQMVLQFEDVWNHLHISYDRFIRTTDEDHKKAVQFLFDTIKKNGDIYKDKYSGWYSVSSESFIPKNELIDGKPAEHEKNAVWIEEENYFFALSKYSAKILDYINRNPDFILPEIRKNEICNVIENGLEDISVSRSSIDWGIPLPFEQNQVVYVWFDALINYITAAGYPDNGGQMKKWWPADVHVIGKDITRFHCVIWPAMLMAAGIELPKRVFGHGFVYLRGEKMSKSTGTVLDPITIAGKYGADPLRYFLMREIAFDRDGDFYIEKFDTRYEADLANDWGNLVQRVLSMLKKYRNGVVPDADVSYGHETVIEWKQLHSALIDTIEEEYDAMRFHVVLNRIWQLIQLSNRFVEQQAPWNLAKDAVLQKELDNTLYSLLEMIRIANILIYPIMPQISEKIQQQLNLSTPFTLDEAAKWGQIKAGHVPGIIQPIFPKK